jgi:hypothetical protein
MKTRTANLTLILICLLLFALQSGCQAASTQKSTPSFPYEKAKPIAISYIQQMYGGSDMGLVALGYNDKGNGSVTMFFFSKNKKVNYYCEFILLHTDTGEKWFTAGRNSVPADFNAVE